MADDDQIFPFEAREIESERREELKKYFVDVFNPSVVRYGPKGYLLTHEFHTVGKHIYNMEVRPDDIFVVSFPKSGMDRYGSDLKKEISFACKEGPENVKFGGTTWTQELVWLIANNYDFKKAKEIPLGERYRFLDLAMLVKKETKVAMSEDQGLKDAINGFSLTNAEELAELPSPRFIKSHFPLSLQPPTLLDTCKVVYVARDPRDVAVSYFHHHRLLKIYRRDYDFKTYWNFFITSFLGWTPYFSHIKEAWEVRHYPNVLLLFYEELSKDLPSCVRRVAKFLDKNITDEQIHLLCDHLNIDNFRKNKAVNLEAVQGTGFLNEDGSFIRKGKVGGWREYFDEEMTEQAKQWIEENLQDTDLLLPQGT